MKRAALSSSIWVLCLSSLVFSSSNLTFTRLSFESGTITGIAIVNPNAQDVTATLTAIGQDGTPLSGNGIQNPVTVKIPAGQQYAKVTSGIFGGSFPSDTVAWVRVTSPADNLTGFFLYLNPSVSFMDGADLPTPSSNLLFLQLRSDSQYSTEINLVNPSNDTKAVVHIELHVGTNVPSFADVILPPSGAVRFDVGTVFGNDALTGDAYLSVGSTVPLAGFELVRGPGDLLGLNAVPTTPGAKTVYIPQMAVLDPFKMELVVVNTGDEATILTIKAHKSDGSLYGAGNVDSNPVNQSLPAHGILRLDVQQLFGFQGSSFLDGWLEIASSSTEVAATAGYLIPGNNSYASVAGSSQGRTRALFSHLATSSPFFTGVALLNSGSLAANVRVVAEKPDGTFLGSYATTLLPGQRISKLVDELIKPAANQGGGLVWVSSDVPIHMLSLFGSSVTLALANIPPQPVPSSFVPGGSQNTLQVTPKLAVLQPNAQQAFNVNGASGTVQWAVNGIPGGNSTIGRIPNGLYQAPTTLPASIPVSITATASDQTAGASVDLLEKETVVGGLGVVSSVAYLSSLQRLYTSELSVQGASGASRISMQSGVSSNILNVTGGSRTLVRDFAGEEISKMVPFTTSAGTEVLLLVGKTTGRIIRLDPRPSAPAPVDVATGLNAPTAAVFDPVTGGLLVAEATQVTLIPAAQLNQGLTQSRITSDTNREPVSPQSIAGVGGSGIAVDPCDGSIFVSDRTTGSILKIDRASGSSQVVANDLSGPGNLLGLQRMGISCPDSFHLFVVEEDADEVSLVIPSTGEVVHWTDAAGARDIAPETDSETGIVTGFFLAQAPDSVGSVLRVSEPGVYDSGQQVVSNAPLPPQAGLYTDYLSFIGALGTNPNILTESFDDIDAGTIIDPGTTIHGITYVSFPPGTKGLVTPPLLDSNGDPVLNPQGKPYGEYNAIGDDFLALSRPDDPGYDYFFGGESMTIRFSKPVRAFGLFLNARTSDIETGYLFLQEGDTVVTTGGPQWDFYNVPGNSSVGLFFAGIISETPFSEVTIGDTSQGDASQNISSLGMIVDHFMRVE